MNTLWKLFGYTDEVIRTVLLPMAESANEPTISMGFDAPLAVLSDQAQSLYNFFKQQFAQVTNPPIDAIREQIVIERKPIWEKMGIQQKSQVKMSVS